MHRGTRTAGTVAALTLILTSCSTPGTTSSSEPAQPPPAPTAEATTVTYQVRGSASTANITLTTPDGTAQHADAPVADATLGYWYETTSMEVGSYASVLAQNTSSGGDITCIILVAGKEAARNTSTGAGAIASCETTVP